MKKLVNGNVVDIQNIELFELAEEGLAMQSIATSATSDGLAGNINTDTVKRYLKQYDLFFKYMPYPLYAIEKDIKYATFGNFIKSFSKHILDIWVGKGLNIRIDKETGMTINFVNGTWSIIYDKQEHEDNTSMDLYKTSTGYKEYCWVLSKVMNKQSTSGFYKEFMPEFTKACNYQPIVFKWELENILTFSAVPDKMKFKTNKILDYSKELEYSLDIYCNGMAETDEQSRVWSFSDMGIGTKVRKKQIKTYAYDAYTKSTSENKTKNKLSKSDLIGLQSIFLELCSIKNGLDTRTFPDFEGVIIDNNIVFVADSKLYVVKTNRLEEPKAIANGVKLYAVDGSKVFFTKSSKINEKIYKESLYAYNIKTKDTRLCKIIFTY